MKFWKNLDAIYVVEYDNNTNTLECIKYIKCDENVLKYDIGCIG